MNDISTSDSVSQKLWLCIGLIRFYIRPKELIMARHPFFESDIRVGTIIEVQDLPNARKPAYVLWIDFGEELGVRKSSAQLTSNYVPSFLKGKQIIAVVNMPAKQIGNLMSECLVLGVHDNKVGVVLLQPEQRCENGSKIS